MLKKYLKIFGVLVFSYFITYFLVKNIFISDTPQVDPNFASRLATNLAFLNLNKKTSEDQTVIFQPVGKGVYAGEDSKTKVVKFVEKEILWQTHTFQVNGREVKIKIPVGQPTPAQEILEKIYK